MFVLSLVAEIGDLKLERMKRARDQDRSFRLSSRGYRTSIRSFSDQHSRKVCAFRVRAKGFNNVSAERERWRKKWKRYEKIPFPQSSGASSHAHPPRFSINQMRFLFPGRRERIEGGWKRKPLITWTFLRLVCVWVWAGMCIRECVSLWEGLGLPPR
jgi:hypothetical protein